MPKGSNPPVLLATLSSSNGFLPGVVIGALIATFASCCGMAAVYFCQRYRQRRAQVSADPQETSRQAIPIVTFPSNPRERQSECSHGKTASSEDTTVVQCDLESSLPLKSPVRDADIVPNEARRTVPRPLSQASVITHDSSIAYYANEFDSPPSAFVGRRFSTASTVSLAGARRTSIELSLPPSPRETSPFSPTSPRAGVFAYMQQNARSPLGSSNTISFASQHRLQREPSANSARHILPSRASSFNSHRSGRISGGSLPRLNTPMGRRSGIIDEIPPLPKSPRFPSPI